MGKVISRTETDTLRRIVLRQGSEGLVGEHISQTREIVAKFIHAFAIDKDIDSIETYKHNILYNKQKKPFIVKMYSQKNLGEF